MMMKIVALLAIAMAPTPAHGLHLSTPLAAHPASAAVAPRAALVAMNKNDPKRASSLNVNAEMAQERKTRRELINKALPGALLGFIVINLASGGAVKDTLGEVKVPGPGPPGMAEAKALKEKSKKKTQENYSKMINGGL